MKNILFFLSYCIIFLFCLFPFTIGQSKAEETIQTANFLSVLFNGVYNQEDEANYLGSKSQVAYPHIEESKKRSPLYFHIAKIHFHSNKFLSFNKTHEDSNKKEILFNSGIKTVKAIFAKNKIKKFQIIDIAVNQLTFTRGDDPFNSVMEGFIKTSFKNPIFLVFIAPKIENKTNNIVSIPIDSVHIQFKNFVKQDPNNAILGRFFPNSIFKLNNQYKVSSWPRISNKSLFKQAIKIYNTYKDQLKKEEKLQFKIELLSRESRVIKISSPLMSVKKFKLSATDNLCYKIALKLFHKN